ncbi:MAG: ABC transporter ATP-binding protein [Victivallales bacterium]|nr:ABC transporter ATP-binding protein [Victivallales bacterium]
MQSEIFLKAVDVHKSYALGRNKVDVLRGVDMEIHKNEWVAVLGASGSGKTTLLNILGTLETADKGSVTCDGTSYSTMRSAQKAVFRRDRIGFVFQAYHMLPELSMIENVKLPAMLREGFKLKDARGERLLERVGLSHRLDHKPAELSGGEQQRAAIARALVNSPDLLLADEPTGNLDTATGKEILEIFKELHNSSDRRTIIMITHDHDVAEYADRKVVLKDGKILT